MAVRLLRPYAGQAVGTTYHGTDEQVLRDTGTGDDKIELASDYQQAARIVATAAVTISRANLIYRMNSATAQTLTLPITGFWMPGTVLSIVQEGAGAFTIAAAPGVTINTAATSLVSKGQWNVAQLLKRGPDMWVAFGGVGG